MINDGPHISTQTNDPFSLEPKDSSMVDCLSSFIILFSVGTSSLNRGPIWMWCTTKGVSVLCVVSAMTMIVVGANIGAHESYQKF